VVGSRLCFFRASRRIDRCVVALSGREGWLGLLMKASSEVDDVVGNAKGYGIVLCLPIAPEYETWVELKLAIAPTTLSIASVATANVSWGEVRHFVYIVFSTLSRNQIRERGMQYDPGRMFTAATSSHQGQVITFTILGALALKAS